MKRIAVLVFISALVLSAAAPAVAANPEKVALKKAKIDQIADFSLNRLFEKSPRARELFEQSYGYAVFDNTKVSLGITGGGGRGVAVNRQANTKLYMKMGSGGLNLGLGLQFFQVVFMFQDETAYTNFTNNGWHAQAGANAVAGRAGANKETTFTNGVAIFQMTDAGLMLQADISGTRYWRAKKFNR
ncbi:MAG: hypothetical protein OEV00_05185 [Acidobacteriota bacterium]|nr:hypothetical protein [Acidobacteriota bacterium]MDH3784708.1 hypothetical protein [Acidobacteriota bacterium]